MFDDNCSDEKKQAVIDFVKWIQSLVPSLPKTATPEEYYNEMTGVQRRRVLKRLRELSAME